MIGLIGNLIGLIGNRLFLVPAATPLAVGLVVLVIGTPSETGMTEVKEDRVVCLACQALHFPAIHCSRRALRIHMTKSKNPKCVQEWSKIKVITRPGNLIAGGACGMGLCPPPQHQLQGVEYTHNILCIFNLHTVYICNIFHIRTQYMHCIYN